MVCPVLSSPPITNHELRADRDNTKPISLSLVPYRRHPSRTKGLDSQVQVRPTQGQCCARRQDQQAKADHGGSGEALRYLA